MKEEDPLSELRRVRDAIAKRYHYDVDAIGRHLSRVPLLPGQKLVDLSARPKRGAAKASVGRRAKTPAPAKKAAGTKARATRRRKAVPSE